MSAERDELPPVGPTVMGMMSGAYVDLLAPDWRDIDLADVAHGLAHIRRFAAQARRQVSLAEHSRLVGRLAPRALRLPALLHDAGHEPAFGDLTRPAFNAIVALAPAARGAIERIKYGLDIATARRVLADCAPGACHDDGEEMEAHRLAAEMRDPAVKAADDRALFIELRALGRPGWPPIPGDAQWAPAAEPDALGEALAWLDEVRDACAARYGGGHG